MNPRDLGIAIAGFMGASVLLAAAVFEGWRAFGTSAHETPLPRAESRRQAPTPPEFTPEQTPAPEPTPAPEAEPASAASTAPERTAERGKTDGAEAATRDLAAGALKWRANTGYGYPLVVPWERVDMTDVLESDFQIKVTYSGGDRHGGCMPSRSRVYDDAYTRSYNAVMRPAIVARHGARVFDIAAERARERTATNQNRHERTAARCKEGNKHACEELDPYAAYQINKGKRR